MEKICGRCAEKIECLSTDIANCSCSKVDVSAKTHEFLGETSYDCLCNKCLTEINQMVNDHPNREPVFSSDFVEGKHFYKENGYFVFTELYHFLKGRCCRNGCRHCPYGNKK
jgi:hypothetical protein